MTLIATMPSACRGFGQQLLKVGSGNIDLKTSAFSKAAVQVMSGA